MNHLDECTDYRKTLLVGTPADVVFDALTTAAGITAWWAPTSGAGGVGGELRLTMNSPEPLLLRVDDATRPSSVAWTVLDCPFLPDWVGTRPSFEVVPLGPDECEVRFRHHGLNAALDCIDMCTRGWDHFLVSLRTYAESGEGSPVGSEGDLARRRAAEPAAAEAHRGQAASDGTAL